jgi:hypothetical protein
MAFNPSTVDEKLAILDIPAKKYISKIINAYIKTCILYILARKLYFDHFKYNTTA